MKYLTDYIPAISSSDGYVVIEEDGVLKAQKLTFDGTTATPSGEAETITATGLFPTGMDEPAYNGGGGGSSMKFYQCTTVDTESKTWSGKELVLTDGVYSVSETLTDGLTYTSITPAAGSGYTEDALVKVAFYACEIPTDCAFYMPGDTFYYKSGESLCLTDNPDVSFYSPSSCVRASATYDGVTGLYFGASGTAGQTYIRAEGGGNLFAKDDTTTNEASGFYARYGAGHPWTYSFWFYPNAETAIGEGFLFTLGKYDSHTYLTLSYNDSDGTFRLRNGGGNDSSCSWAGYAEQNKWCHLCITGDDSAHIFSLYINGVYVQTLTNTQYAIPSANYTNPQFILGGHTRGNAGSNVYAAIGCQTNMKWFNRVLSQSEITALASEFTPTA
ncbi:MAG: LamG domain-containing protein [Lentisphaeria bacterium]|nr:LamG domain-containing protein [Lentisphaeria bacterium]